MAAPKCSGFTGIQVGSEFFKEMGFEQRMLVPAFDITGDFLQPFSDGFQIGENKLGLDDFDVAERVHTSGYVNDVRVFETSNDVHQSIYFPDVAQELVAKPLPLGSALHQTRNIHKLNGRRYHRADLGYLGNLLQPLVGHSDDAEVWLNGAKGVVFSDRLVRARNRVEERGFSNVWKSNDSCLQHTEIIARTWLWKQEKRDRV